MKPLRVAAVALLIVIVLGALAMSPLGSSSLAALRGLQPASAAAQAAGTPTGTAPGLITPGGAPGGTAAATTALPTTAPIATSAVATGQAPVSTPVSPTVRSGSLAALNDLQSAMEGIYQSAQASVVNVEVTEGGGSTTDNATPTVPFPRNQNPFGNSQPFSQALGSGVIWDKLGNIITNNHVIAGASSINVTFSSGNTVTATLVGADPDSDLAVIKVNPAGLNLQPITVADSAQVRPGQFVVAIGNPFGLQGTMTFGIVSALGRSLPAGGDAALLSNAPSYTIPDIIQTDAPINPGNSGGALLNLQGQLIGVPSAIESQSNSSSGVGFVIPSSIVNRIVPELIQTGKVQHAWLGISGTSLTPDLAKAMNLPVTQRGALVEDVTSGGPAASAGLQASTQTVTVNGQDIPVGGDVIVKVDNQAVNTFDDLSTYLFNSAKPGQAVTLTVLRNGSQTTVQVKLGTRPATPPVTTLPGRRGTPSPRTTPSAPATPEPQTTPAAPGTASPQATAPAQAGTAWLGISAVTVDQEVAQAMNLSANQQGALIESVVTGSPADKAGLQGSSKSFTTSQGQQITVGGDIITGANNQTITSIDDLVSLIQGMKPGDQLNLTVLRNGSNAQVTATLAARPSSVP